MNRLYLGLFSAILLNLTSLTSNAQGSGVTDKQIALTIDDLPFVGSTHNNPRKLARENQRLQRMMAAVTNAQVPCVGFVIAGTIEQGQWQLMETFHQQGIVVANHTYNHLNLNRTGALVFIENIDKAQEKLAPLVEGGPKFFRYPYLAEGRGQRKQTVRDYLMAHHFIIAPVTIDSHDFRYNQRLYRIPYRVRKHKQNLSAFKDRYLSHIWYQTLRAERLAKSAGQQTPRQILLLHANMINSLFLEDIIAMYQSKGYRFIALADALSDKTAQKKQQPHTSASVGSDTVSGSSLSTGTFRS